MNLKGADRIVTADVIKESYEDALLIVMSEQGYGKMSKMSEYKVQKRGGSGIKTAKVTPKTGKLMTGMIVPDREGEIVGSRHGDHLIRKYVLVGNVDRFSICLLIPECKA